MLDRRALNRATLARQLLLERAPLTPVAAVEHLVGLQAQNPHDPYTGLWSRLDPFAPESLSRHLAERDVVRIVVMRGTIHLVTADDCLLLRPLVQPVLDAELGRHAEYAPQLAGVDLGPVLAFARSFLEERPRTSTVLRAALAERFPAAHPGALAYACRNHLALVQTPPRGLWGRAAGITLTTAEAWLGRRLAERPSPDEVVLRYLAAFGPATVADISAWSRLTGQRAVVERLRHRLRVFRDENGRELLDLPDAPRPDPATPAPPRFLPEYDNALLAHADRSRFHSGDARVHSRPGARIHGTVLADGFLCGAWRLDRDRDRGGATLEVMAAHPLEKPALDAVVAEGRRLLGFLAGTGDGFEVRVGEFDERVAG